MQKNLKEFVKIKNDLKVVLKNKAVFDVVLFGSFVKGKENPGDIDVAIICSEKLDLDFSEEYHVSWINLNDFFVKSISLGNTLLREGFSLRHNKYFSEVFGFQSKLLFVYDFSNLENSKKVKFVNILRGLSEKKGVVEIHGGEWVARQVFLTPVSEEVFFDDLFSKNKIKYKKSFNLIH
jgi:predicted nucleotidyltransferase